jgi:integrase
MIAKRTYVPTMDEYRKTLERLVDESAMTELIAVRLGCECGMSRLEIVNALKVDVDKINKRGLWISIAKKIYRGKKKGENGKKIKRMEMRTREVPINLNLYQLLKVYIESSEIYVLHRERGDATEPFCVDMIDKWYYQREIPWATHRSRHFFKGQVFAWMIKNRRPDDAVLKEIMGHVKNVHESYGVYPWDYKLEIVDGVFQ